MSVDWKPVFNSLRDEFSTEDYATWIRPLKVDGKGKKLILVSPNQYVFKRVEKDFLQTINARLADLGYGPALLRTSEPERRNRPKAVGKRDARPPRSNLNRNYTFTNFIKGSCNMLALQSALDVSGGATAQALGHNPLLLHGGTGLGKTHLLHAIGNAMVGARPDATVLYVESKPFTEDVVEAIRRKAIQGFGKTYKKADILLLDDLQFLSNKEKTQEEFFHIFNHLQNSGSQLVLSAERHPKQIGGLQERLRSRLMAGLIVPLEPPEQDTRVEILRKLAERHGLQLQEEVAAFVAEHAGSSVRDLEGAFKSLLAHSRSVEEEISLPCARKAMLDLMDANKRQTGVASIQQQVAAYYHLAPAELLSRTRAQSVSRPRQLAMSLARDLTNLSLSQIGAAFGGRDHSTVFRAIGRMEELRRSEMSLDRDYKRLRRLLVH